MRHEVVILVLTVVLVYLSGFADLTFSQASTAGQSEKDISALQDTTLAAKFLKRGKELAQAAKYDSSNTCYERALEIYEKLAEENQLDILWGKTTQCLNSIGDNLRRQEKYEQALEYLNQAIEVGSERLGENHLDVAISYRNIGIVYFKRGDYDLVLEYFQKSLSIKLRLLGTEHLDVAKSYNNIGVIYRNKGDLDKALEYSQKSISIKLRVLREDHPDLANSYMGIANVYWSRGDYDQALKYHQKSLSIRVLLLGGEHPDVAASYNNIGVVYLWKGDYDQALQFFQKSISIKLRLLGDEHHEVANGYIGIGAVYQHKDDYDRALEYYQKSLSIKARALGEEHPDVALVYHNIGEVHNLKGEHDRSLGYYQRSLSTNLRLLGEQHPQVALTYKSIGGLYNKKGDYDPAIEFLHKALAVGLKVWGQPDVAGIYQDLAEAYYQKRDFNMALTFCQKSIISLVSGFDDHEIYSNPPLEGISRGTYLLCTLALKAKVFARLSRQSGKEDLERAFTNYQLAVALIDKMRTSYKAEGSKLLLGENAVEIYEKAIDIALKLHQITGDDVYKETAFLFAEKGKASVLSQALHETQAKAFAGIPETILARERQLRIDLAFYDTQIQKERQKKEDQDETKIQDFESRYFSLRTEYDALIEEFEKTYPRYYDLKYQTGTASVSELQESLDPQTMVVEFFVGEQSIYIFTIAKSHYEITTVLKDSSFETDIEQMRSGIDKNGGEGDYELYVTSACRLFRSLIQPVQSHLQTEKLILIPDDVIARVPFEALLTEEVTDTKGENYSTLPYLLRRYEISYALSASLLLDQISPNPADPPRDYIAFAPIYLDGIRPASRAGELVTANRKLDLSRTSHSAPLPGSRDEVLGIQQIFRKSYGFFDRLVDWMFDEKSRVYLESQADEETLKKETLTDYRYIHFATHGFANRNVPDLSGLVLAQDSSSSEDDVLFLNEIYNLELNSDLVTLSACESGIGRLVKGEGLFSLSRGFLYAGAKSLLVSLWEASDRTTCELMLAFYDGMLKGKSKAAALRQAKFRLIQGQYQTIDSQVPIAEYTKPYYWAPFILIGKSL